MTRRFIGLATASLAASVLIPFAGATPANAIPILASGLPSGCDAYTLPGHTPTYFDGVIQGDVWVRCSTAVFIQIRGTLLSSSPCYGFSTGSSNSTSSWTIRYRPAWKFTDEGHFAYCNGGASLPVRSGGGVGGGGGGPW